VHAGLNLVFLVPGETGGMETYARELLPRLAAVDGLRVTAFVNREAAEAGGPWADVPHEVIPVRARNRIEWVRGEQQHLPRVAARARCDVLHSLASTAPLRGPTRRVTTIHDLNYRLVPEAHFGLRGLGMRLLVPAAARRSHRIIVPSESTRRDLAEHLRVPLDKVDVVPEAAAPPAVAAVDGAVLRVRLGLGDRPVVLSLSAKRPHKNLVRLIRALGAIPAERRPVLVIPGYPTPYEGELRAAAEWAGVSADVVFCGWLDAGEVEGLYALAACVVFPSLYEGFGLPVLEAMVRGVPVASSDRSSLPEVAADAALLFDPTDEAAIRAAIERLIGDSVERDRLRAAGLRRASAFSWERTAELTAASYERALRA
jgi:glycosyltransferase involved in cell wall biosynthesis